VERHRREIDADFPRLSEHVKGKMAVMEIVAQIRQVGIISGFRYTYDLRLSTATVTPRAQQQQPPEDPEDDKKLGLWLDQGISSGLTPSKSLEIEFHERYDEVISNFYEYFVQGGIAFRVRPWLTVTPLYRYQRFPGIPRSLTKTGCYSTQGLQHRRDRGDLMCG
jgi:hypothetical protein